MSEYRDTEEASDVRFNAPYSGGFGEGSTPPPGAFDAGADGHFTHDGVPMRAAIYAVPEFERTRSAIKAALGKLLLIDLTNDDDEEVAAKLRSIASGLIEAL